MKIQNFNDQWQLKSATASQLMFRTGQIPSLICAGGPLLTIRNSSKRSRIPASLFSGGQFATKIKNYDPLFAFFLPTKLQKYHSTKESVHLLNKTVGSLASQLPHSRVDARLLLFDDTERTQFLYETAHFYICALPAALQAKCHLVTLHWREQSRLIFD